MISKEETLGKKKSNQKIKLDLAKDRLTLVKIKVSCAISKGSSRRKGN